MTPYISDKTTVYELGSGAGFSKEFLHTPSLKMTDVVTHPWIDCEVDALNMPFETESVDVLIASHMIHHLANPLRFFSEASRVLKPGGQLLISEINTSLITRILLRLLRHEGYSYDVDVFSLETVANDPSDPWSANCAIPQLLFSNPKQFETQVPQFSIALNEVCECFIFPLSGGVIAKTKMVELPIWVLNGIHRLDQFLIRLFPSVFAMGRRVVLVKAPCG
jgi:hypothetical protein